MVRLACQRGDRGARRPSRPRRRVCGVDIPNLAGRGQPGRYLVSIGDQPGTRLRTTSAGDAEGPIRAADLRRGAGGCRRRAPGAPASLTRADGILPSATARWASVVGGGPWPGSDPLGVLQHDDRVRPIRQHAAGMDQGALEGGKRPASPSAPRRPGQDRPGESPAPWVSAARTANPSTVGTVGRIGAVMSQARIRRGRQRFPGWLVPGGSRQQRAPGVVRGRRVRNSGHAVSEARRSARGNRPSGRTRQGGGGQRHPVHDARRDVHNRNTWRSRTAGSEKTGQIGKQVGEGTSAKRHRRTG